MLETYERIKEDEVVEIMKRWVNGDITSTEADKELEKAGVNLPSNEEVQTWM